MISEVLKNNIFNHSAGLLSDLEKAITEPEVRNLERLGYIENAVSPKGETWKLSSKGKKARKALEEKPSLLDYITDFFYRHILHYHVSI